MKQLSSPKATYLLEAGLEVLHEQSTEWLSEVEFWKDECAFLYTLVLNKTRLSVPIEGKELIQKAEDELVSITCGELDDLRNAVEVHEQQLNYLLTNKLYDDEFYRDQHKVLALRFYKFEKKFRAMKKNVFALAKMMGGSRAVSS